MGPCLGGPFQPLCNRLGQGLPPMLSLIALNQDTKGSCFERVVILLFHKELNSI